MNLYLPAGWLDIEMIDTYMDVHHIDQCFIVGARGTGKSYGIQKMLVKKNEKFVYSRMSGNEIKMIGNPEMNPFNAFHDDPEMKDLIFSTKPIPKMDYSYYLYVNDNILGICLPLVTFGKFRGVDFHEYTSIFLDEFIPERTIKKTPGMGSALKNAYETVNRNRELKGGRPVKLYAAANSLDMNNEILLEFGLIPMMEKCLKSDKEYWVEGNKILIYPRHSPISEAKSQTSLYRDESGKFSDMALSNEFSDYSRKNIGSRSINGAACRFRLVGCFTMYKLQNGDWYCTTFSKIKKDTDIYMNNDYDKRCMLNKYYFLATSYMNGRITFERPDLELLFCEYFKIKL